MQVVLRRLWIQLTADRKRFGVLCGTLLLGLLLWGRIIVTSDLPRTAIADPDPPGGNTDPGDGAGTDKPPVRRVAVRLAYAPDRDPLLISDAHFPKPTNAQLMPEDDPKLPPNPPDDPQQADRRRTQELWNLVGRYQLDGVMQGRPMAVINGKAHTLFSWIPAVGDDETFFQLVEVAHRSVWLECEGRRFRLSMDNPGNEGR